MINPSVVENRRRLQIRAHQRLNVRSAIGHRQSVEKGDWLGAEYGEAREKRSDATCPPPFFNRWLGVTTSRSRQLWGRPLRFPRCGLWQGKKTMRADGHAERRLDWPRRQTRLPGPYYALCIILRHHTRSPSDFAEMGAETGLRRLATASIFAEIARHSTPSPLNPRGRSWRLAGAERVLHRPKSRATKMLERIMSRFGPGVSEFALAKRAQFDLIPFWGATFYLVIWLEVTNRLFGDFHFIS
jgi:hypothetical protein